VSNKQKEKELEKEIKTNKNKTKKRKTKLPIFFWHFVGPFLFGFCGIVQIAGVFKP